MNVFSVIYNVLRREPLLLVPYVVYSLLGLIATQYLGPKALMTASPMAQMPYRLLLFLFAGESIARGVSVLMVASQFATLSRSIVLRWTVQYVMMSVVLSGFYAVLTVLVPKVHASLSPVLLALVLGGFFVLAMFSVVCILFAPLVLFFRGTHALFALAESVRLMWRRPLLVTRVVFVTLSIVFFFLMLGGMFASIPVIGLTLLYLCQAFGYIVGLIYGFLVVGESEWKQGLVFSDKS